MFGTNPSLGASLLAKAVGQPASMVHVPPSSRARFAPTDLRGVRPEEPGRLLACCSHTDRSIQLHPSGLRRFFTGGKSML
nr:hypothetical protein C1892_29235 [Pseudomonas sp. MPBD7-1]